MSLAKEYGSRLHVAHLSTERELELFEAGNPLITAEACVAHLLFTDKYYARLGTRIKCNPAIKTEADRAALRRALADGRITTVATDHAPHRLRDKVGGCVKAASGMPMLQYSLVSMLELVDEGVVSIERMVELMCHAPARIFRIENRGFLRAYVTGAPWKGIHIIGAWSAPSATASPSTTEGISPTSAITVSPFPFADK